MAQNSKPRHSKTTKKPVTIDLEADAVKSDKDQKPEPEASPAGGKETAGEAAATRSTPQVKPTTSGDNARKAEEPAKPAQPAAASSGSQAASAAKPAPAAGTKQEDKSAKPEDKPAGPAEPAKSESATKPAAATGAKKEDAKTTKSADKGGKPFSTEPPSATGRKPAGGGGRGGWIAAGLIGGIVALVLAGVLQWAGVIPGPKGETVSASDLAQIRQSISALESRAGNDASSVTDSLDARIKALEDREPATPPDNSAVADLQKQVSDLASKVDAAGSAAPDATLTSKLADIEKSQSDLQASLDKTGSQISDLSSRIDSLQADDTKALQAIDTRLSAVEKSVAGPREDIKVARALAAASLKSAIDRGGSFMAELEAYASIEGTSDAVDQLHTLAASGVPTQAQLISEFSADVSRIIQAGESGTPSEGVFNRLLDSATSLVTVRPVGEVAGDSTEAIVARLENRLKNGDLQGAVNEWNTLPKPAQDASADFIKELKARILADKLVAGMLSDAMPVAPAAAPAEGGKN